MPGAFDEDPKEPRENRVKLKQVSSQKSMFEDMPKRKPTQQEFQQQVHAAQERSSSYKVRAAKLVQDFAKMMADKTLPENKSIFAKEGERELLGHMMQLAIEINNDPSEENEGMGSLSWIVVLFNTCLAHRDRLNFLEFKLERAEKIISSTNLTDFINKEVNKALDKKKPSE